MPPTRVRCSRCETDYQALPGSPQQCPRCLLGLALAPPPLANAAPFARLQTLFPDFQLQALIGRGGMGVVYRALHTKTDKLIALKLLLPELAEDPAFTERFQREAHVLARLQHPSIVGLHDFGHREDTFFLAMEFVDGPNLRALLGRRRLKPTQVLTTAAQICDGLAFAHDIGIVHRDLKPENILIDEHGNARIADFGLARLLGTKTEQMGLTITRQVLGTPHYMAPEQVQGASHVDQRADLYSLGVMLYEMLTCELPIGRFQPPSARHRGSRGCDTLVMKLLENDPQRRYQTAADAAGEVATARMRIAAMQPAAPSVTPTATSLVRRDLRSHSRHLLPRAPLSWGRLAPGLAFVASLFTILALVWFLTPPRHPKQMPDSTATIEASHEAPNLAALALSTYTTFVPSLPESGCLDIPTTLLVHLRRSRQLDRVQSITAVLSPIDGSNAGVERQLAVGDNNLFALAGRYQLKLVVEDDGKQYETAVVPYLRFFSPPSVPDHALLVQVGPPPPLLLSDPDGADAPLPFEAPPRLDTPSFEVSVERFLSLSLTARTTRSSIGSPLTTNASGVSTKRFLSGHNNHRISDIDLLLLQVPAQTFQMGSPDHETWRESDEQLHAVTLSRPFWLSSTEVTRSQWFAIMGTRPWGHDTRPEGTMAANCISWTGAVSFCEQLSTRERKARRLTADYEYRLPTEAQWEAACRSGTSTAYSFGDDAGQLSKYAAYFGSCPLFPQVGTLRPNTGGFYDMHGNLWEWCADRSELNGLLLVTSTYGRAQIDPVETRGSQAVLRGGAFDNGPSCQRSADRWSNPVTSAFPAFGFRVALQPISVAEQNSGR